MGAVNAYPNRIVVMGKTYAVTYVEYMERTDIDKRSALWGQVDYHTRTIRVFIGKDERARQPADIWETLLHEIVHAILADNQLMQKAIKDGMEEAFVDNLGCALADTLARNGILGLGGL